MKTRGTLATILVVIALSVLAVSGCDRMAQQSYPSKAIDLVVHNNPGSAADVFVRMVADILEKEKISPQPFSVLNKPGGNGAVALSYVAEKKGDGYTVANMQNVHLMTLLSEKAGTLAYKDFTPLGNLMFDPNLIMVREESKFKTINDLVEEAKKKPQGVSVGFGSIGSADHIVAFRIGQHTGAQFNYIAFAGGGTEAATQMLGGHVDFCMGQVAEASGLIAAKKIRILATATDKRLPVLPDVATLKELGLPVSFYQFRGFIGPPDMPKDAAQYLDGMFKKLSETKRFKDYAEGEGVGTAYMSAADFGKFLTDWAAQLVPTVDAMGLKAKK